MTNPDFCDPKLCICGEEMELNEEFCSRECEADFYEVQYAMHLETQNWYTQTEVMA